MSSASFFVDCDENKTVNYLTSLCVNGTVFQHNSTSQVFTEGRSRGPIVFTIFVLLVCTAFAGNMVVLVSWFRNKVPRRIIYYYTSNLASADLLATAAAALNPISNHTTSTAGDLVCKINYFAMNTSFTASILTLVAIGLTRYQAITSITPTNLSQQKKNLARKRCCLIWLIAIITASPVLSEIGQNAEPGRNDCVRKNNWPVLYLKVYYALHLVFFFIFPLLFIMFVSCRIYSVLRKNTAPNAPHSDTPSKPSFTVPPKNINRTKILFSTVFTFMICVGPISVTRTLELLFESSNIIPFSLSRVFQLLWMLNGVLDPLIYLALSSEIRKAIYLIATKTPERRELWENRLQWGSKTRTLQRKQAAVGVEPANFAKKTGCSGGRARELCKENSLLWELNPRILQRKQATVGVEPANMPHCSVERRATNEAIIVGSRPF